MKKSMKIFYIFIIFLFLFSVTANAFTVTLSSSENNVKSGEYVILNIKADEKIVASNFYIDYDSDKFEFVQGINVSAAINNGKLACIYADITGTGTDNFQVRFKAKELSKVSKADFSISDYKFRAVDKDSSYEGEDVKFTSKNISIEVNPSNTVTPTITPTPTVVPTPTNSPAPTTVPSPSVTPTPTSTVTPTAVPTQTPRPTTTINGNSNDNTKSDKKIPNTGSKAIILIVFGVICLVSAVIFKVKENNIKKLFMFLALFISVTLVTSNVKAVSNTELKIDINNSVINNQKSLLISLDNADTTRKITKTQLVEKAKEKNINIKSISNKNNQNIESNDLVATGYIANIDNENYKVVLYGDSNGDGYICDADDLTEILNDYIGKKKLTNEYKLAANLANNDDILDSDDLMQMINRFLGKLNGSLVVNYPGSSNPTPTATVSPSQIPTATPTVIPTPSSIPTPTPAVTPTPSSIPTPTPTSTVTPSPTATPTTEPTATPTTEPTATPTIEPTPTPTPTSTPEPSNIINKTIKIANVDRNDNPAQGIKIQVKDSSGNIVKNNDLDYFISDSEGNININIAIDKTKFELPQYLIDKNQTFEESIATYYTFSQVCEDGEKDENGYLSNGYYFNDGEKILTIACTESYGEYYITSSAINSTKNLVKLKNENGEEKNIIITKEDVSLKILYKKLSDFSGFKYENIMNYDETENKWSYSIKVQVRDSKFKLEYFYGEDLTNKYELEFTENELEKVINIPDNIDNLNIKVINKDDNTCVETYTTSYGMYMWGKGYNDHWEYAIKVESKYKIRYTINSETPVILAEKEKKFTDFKYTDKVTFELLDENGNVLNKITEQDIFKALKITVPSSNTKTLQFKIKNVNTDNEPLAGISYTVINDNNEGYNCTISDEEGISNVEPDFEVGKTSHIYITQKNSIQGYKTDTDIIEIEVTVTSDGVSVSIPRIKEGRLNELSNGKIIQVDGSNVYIEVVHQKESTEV